MSGPFPNGMPYRRGPGCDICGLVAPLERVELEPEREASCDGSRPFRAARVIYVCLRHAKREGRPRTPRTETAAGTSRRKPQRETLFGEPEPEHGCAGGCRYPDICPPCVDRSGRP